MPPHLQRNACQAFALSALVGMSAAAMGGCGDTKLMKMTAQSTSGTSLTLISAEEGFQAMPSADLAVILQHDSELLITFNAVGVVPVDDAEPSLHIRCEIDGRSCSNEPPGQGVAFLYHYPRRESRSCCPQDSQQWLTPKVAKGFHSIAILGKVNGGLAAARPIGEWSLIVEAITH